MSKGVKIAIGIVAAIAIPFVAPVIAGAIGGSALFAGTALGGFLGGAGGSALVGAGLGAASSAATGRSPLLGAALGGLGGFAGGGGFSGLFGASTGGAGAGVGETAASLAEAPAYNVATMGRAAAEAAGQIPAAAATTAAEAATTGVSLSSLGSSLAAGINPSNIAQLAATMYNVSNYNDLSAERKAAVQEAAQAAATNQELFKQRVEAARRVAQLGTPDTAGAYARTAIDAERRLTDAQRAAPFERQQEARRRTDIERTRLGVFAANQENARANQAASTAANMIPTAAPGGPAMASYLGAAADIRDRAQLAMQGANLVSRMFPNEQDRRPAGLFTTSMFG